MKTSSIQQTLAVALLLPGTLAAQQSLDQARDAAFREAERYAICWAEFNLTCVEKLTDKERLDAAGMLAPELERMRTLSSNQRGLMDLANYRHTMEVAEPWPPFGVDDVLFAFVPYFETLSLLRNGSRSERVAYLVGTSVDGGESWRFIQVNRDSTLQPNTIDRVVPGYAEGPRPAALEFIVQERPLAESRGVETTERRFVPVDGAFAYAVNLLLRRSYRDPIDLSVRYDDPADRNQPLQFRGSLEPGQRQVQWQSAALSSFETGEVYSVVIEGSDPDTGELLFAHREELLFQPTRELWLSVLSKPPGETAE